MAESGKSSGIWKVLTGLFAVIILGGITAAAAYFFWIAEDDDEDGGNATGVTVTSVIFSNEIDANGLPANPRIAMPAGTRAVRASVRMTGVTAGMTVEGKWFQLGPSSGGAEGAEVSASEVVLAPDAINENGASRVSFSLGTNGPELPTDTWLLRVYVNGDLVKTSGFVIATNNGSVATSPAASPTRTP